ncbi:MAG: hypothetical protein LBE92_17165 [Chryseobacterium sp.]|jgi:hypothetical protein|uniref:hypothetical protein n=1 Tax=Chryseobacterium sp. TaxID=1871047 RepID=UPI00282F2B2F|nr:hypothetical protein [Chryseobacterium sp.]MDR2237856.1 hypothetical protein [Chryseobacterium sp.]
MKKIFSVFLFIISAAVSAQKAEIQNSEQISDYFDEIKTAAQRGAELWNQDLYGSILLVEPKTRQLYSNEADTDKTLKEQGAIYSGKLPDHINIANTSIVWNGKTWAMIMLPLPENKYDRINLLAHELFHRVQASLGFVQSNKESIHLDQKDGRIFLRLELEALTKAILSDSKKEQKTYLTDALTFRKYRNSLFPESAAMENQLELNEGLAEYTGLIISGRDRQQTKEHFASTISSFLKNPTFVRSFAYHTTPAYGYLLGLTDQFWNQKIKGNTDLTAFFIQSFAITVPDHLKAATEKAAVRYNGKKIASEEKTREEKIKKQIAAYKSQFIDQPHFDLRFEKMNVSFDPRNMVPLEDKGTVYPQIRVTDNWGILEAEKGALMSKNWDKISVSFPTKISDETVEGDGWKLQLNKGYSIKKDAQNIHYQLIKE